MILNSGNLLIMDRGRSQTTLTRFWLFLTSYPPVSTFPMVRKLTKNAHFWTTYLPCLVNVVCERPLILEVRNQKYNSFATIRNYIPVGKLEASTAYP